MNQSAYEPKGPLATQEHLDTAQEFIAGAIEELSAISGAFRFAAIIEDVISKLRESQCAIDQLRAKMQEHERTRVA